MQLFLSLKIIFIFLGGFRDIFSLGFGPFRWICTSGLEEDLQLTDKIAADVLESILAQGLPENIAAQYIDNIKWIREAGANR